MAKQLNVSLGFSADTSQAKKQLQELQTQLKNLVSSTNSNKSNFALTQNLKEATMAATQLQAQLESAINVDTGRLDLGKFSQSLKKSGMSIEQYKNSLHQLGPAGDQAFASLAQSIMQAEVPLRRSNALVAEMWTSLKNTARWQISSSILHGFMGAIQTAYGYAQDLNESLTNIRIVTGQNADEMAEFAERANKAAKALSSTTTEYTNASLIYYQQGLSDSEVEERTNVTIKMANASGQSAEIVSDQLTAIWNNFYDGSKSLEYYADVMTALGAATASSTEEIAGGLEKFAAIGETIGLSYEYAASALATITSNTRQSEEVVGTALKTIFARIQGLNLGETLEDGVTLNKYSEALQAVGISIFDSAGELKNMDSILSEMASRWDTISNAQQTALAQTVAGVRQYTQLVALMENWDNGDNDSMMANLSTAQNAEGAVSVQADIYAQSWEAAQKRVTASAESIYSALLNDELFIDLNNGLAGFLEGLGKVIDGMGGLKGILLMVGSVALTVFRDQISQSVQNIVYSIKMLTTKGKEQIKELRDQANQALINGSNGTPETAQEKARAEAYAKLGSLQNAYLKNASKMSEEQKKIAQSLMDQQQILIKNVELANEEVTAAEEQLALAERKMTSGFQITEKDEDGEDKKSTVSIKAQDKERIKALTSSYKELQVQAGQYKKYLEQIGKIKLNSKEFEEQKKNLKVWSDQIKKSGIDIEKTFGKKAKNAFDNFNEELEKSDGKVEDLDKALDKLYSSIDGIEAGTKEYEKLEEVFKRLKMPPEEIRKRLDELTNSANKTGESYSNLSQKSSILSSYTDQIAQNFEKLHATTSVGDKFMAVASSIGNVVSIVNTLKSTIEALNDSDLSFGEKVMAAMSGISMIAPSIIALLDTQNLALMKSAGMWILEAGAKKLATGESVKAKAAEKLLTAIKNKESIAVAANSVAWYANPIMWIAIKITALVAVIGLLIAGIALLTNWLIKGEKINTKYCDTLIENAEKTKELAEANDELSDSMDDLIDDFQRLSAEGENTAETLEKIKEQMPDLIKSYRDFSNNVKIKGLDEEINKLEKLANIAQFTGDYSEFNSQKEKIDDKILVATAKSAQTGAKQSGIKLAASMQDQGGKIRNNNSYSFIVGSGKEKKDGTAVNILKEEMGSYAKGPQKGEVNLSLDNYENPLELVDYYEKMVAARNRMLTEMDSSERENSKAFQQINEMIGATAEAYNEAKEQADDYLGVVGDALQAEMQDKSNLEGLNIQGDVDTMAEYLEYKEKFIEIAQDEYGLTEDQAEAQLKQVEGLERMSNEYELASTMLTNFSGLTEKQIENFEKIAPGSLQEMTDEIAKNLTTTFGDMSDEELAVAVSIAADAESIEDFSQQMQQAVIETTRAGYQQSAIIASEALQSSLETGTINMGALLDDDNFLEYLEEINMSVEAITSASYEEQYRIISDFYSKINTAAFDSFSAQQELYYQQIADIQGELAAYHKAISNGSADEISETQAKYKELRDQLAATDDKTEIAKINKQMQEMKENFSQEYGFDIESNAVELQNELDKILQTIDELQDQKIEMAMDWGDVDELENGFKKAAQFTQMIQKDTKKVGNSYQMTAAQAREWLEFYPELGSIAEVTTDGLISMNTAEVDAFITGKEEELDMSVETKIKELESQKAVLQADLEAKKAELTAAEALAKGKIQLEDMSAQYLTELRGNLTQYFMDLGMDEVTANAAALETMNMNEEEYSQAVAEACENQAENMIYAAEDGANAQASSLTQLAQRWASFGSYLISNIGPILLEIGKAILDPTKTVSGVMRNAWNASAISVDTSGNHTYTTDSGNYTFNSGDQSQITAALESVSAPQLDSIKAAISEIEGAIGSIDGQISYLQALGTEGLDNLGNADFGGQNKDKNSDKKSVEELIEMAERYHEITREIQTLEHELDILNKKKSQAFGKDKLALMEQESKKMKQLADNQKKLLEVQTLYLAADKVAVQDVFANAQFDENGNISNYTSLVSQAATEFNAAKEIYNNSEQEDADKEALDKAEKTYEEKIKLLEQYEDTLDQLRETEASYLDSIINWQDSNFEKINYQFEIEVALEDNALKWIDYQLEKLEDDFYSAAEAAALFFDISNQKGTKYGQTLEQIKITTQQFAEAEKMYNSFDENGNRLISQANYIEAMNQARDSYYDQLAALQEIDDAMMNYYSETLDKASEELAKYTDQMEHLNSVMDHYSSLMSIMGKEKDYESMGIILEGQASLAEDRLKAAESTFKMFASEKDEAYSKWQQALKDGNAAAAELYEKEYQAALQKANEAEEEFLASAEETIEAWKAVLENSLEEMGSSLEKALTGGRTFDQMSATMERINSIHEEYLTTTNKIYETNKMMRTVQQEIDKTSNTAAKRRLKQFIEQTQELQDQKVLSQFELDIQKAKYDLLLAEIALEEAQNAKSQVRLQRDSEGNFGYVYTADTSAVDDAQQKFEDAQNNLYNISLDGANKYAEQRQVLMQEMYDQMRELQTQYLNGEFANEQEYNKALDELKAYYYEKLRQASELYNVAISADSDAAAENILGDSHLVAMGALGDFDTIAKKWQDTLLVTMDKDTSDWKEKVENYLLDVNKAFTNWSNNCEAISKKTHLDELAKKTKAIKTESENLVTEITKKGGILEALKKEFDAVKLVTDEYARKRREVQGLVGDIEGYITALDKKQDAEAKKNSEETKTGNKQEEQKSKAEQKPKVEEKLKVEEKPKPKKISADRIQEGFDLIMAGAWGKGWDNRKKKALAAGFTEEEFELIKKKIDQYFASNTPKPTKSAAISVTSQPTAPYTTFTATSYAKNWMSFDTGGYTGNWEGPYGKLAMLHKKELVLNERDTANFLASMEVLERILSIIDLQSANAQYIGAINSPALKSTGQDTLEQNVHIEASFPNVTDRNEIEEAFKDIVNLASQYANRK